MPSGSTCARASGAFLRAVRGSAGSEYRVQSTAVQGETQRENPSRGTPPTKEFMQNIYDARDTRQESERERQRQSEIGKIMKNHEIAKMKGKSNQVLLGSPRLKKRGEAKVSRFCRDLNPDRRVRDKKRGDIRTIHM